MGHPGLGGRVQPAQVAGADRLHSARRDRSRLLPSPDRVRHGGVTHNKQPPEFQGRFTNSESLVKAQHD